MFCALFKQLMKTRTTDSGLTLEKGFQNFIDFKLSELKATGKRKKEKQMAEIQSIWKQLSDAEKRKWTSKSLGFEEQTTPLKQRGLKSKAEDKKMPVTSSTAKRTSTSKLKIQAQAEDQKADIEDVGKVNKILFAGKSKPIKKQSKRLSKTQEYQHFYKFHFEKLKEEHPNWNVQKITQIISLLWKKAKMESKHSSEKQMQKLYENIMAGKDAFKAQKLNHGVKENEIDALWSRLPVQSKRKWQLQGNGLAILKMSKKPSKMNFLKAEQPKLMNQFSFMKRLIQ